MNPFVNPNKRSISLPVGCKDLIDVLNREKKADNETCRKFIKVVLFQAQQDNATEVIIGKALPDGTTPIRYKVKEAWIELSPFPSDIRSTVISELAQMAIGLGAFDLSIGCSRSRWRVEITSAVDECRLVCIQKEDPFKPNC